MHRTLVILVLLVLAYAELHTEGFENDPTEIVIAHYNENLKWVESIRPPGCKVTVYTKHPEGRIEDLPEGADAISLPNVGRDAHTYLEHVCRRYDSLADVTYFLPGSATTWFKRKNMRELLADPDRDSFDCGNKQGPPDPEFEIDEWNGTSSENGTSEDLQPAKIRPFGKWFDAMFPGETFPTNACFNIMLRVPAANIRARPLHKYQELRAEVDKHSNSEEIHYLERSFHTIFKI